MLIQFIDLNEPQVIDEGYFKGIPIFSIEQDYKGVTLFENYLSSTIDSTNNTTVVVVDNNYDLDDVLVIDVNIDPDTNIDTIIVNNNIYTLDTDYTYLPGTFTIDPITNQILIVVNNPIYVNDLVKIYSSIPNLSIEDNVDDTRVLLGGENVLTTYYCVGTINISRSFNSYPTGSIVIVGYVKDLISLESKLKNKNLQWKIDNIPFRTQSFSKVIEKISESPSEKVVYSITLESWWIKELSEVVYIRNVNDNVTTTDCNSTSTANSEETDSNSIYITLDSLLGKKGIALKGVTNLKLKFPKSTSTNTTISLDSALSQALNNKPYLFAYYSSATGIYIYKWDKVSSGRSISNKRISSSLNTTYNVLDTKIYPTEYEWNFAKENLLGIKEDSNTNNNIPEFEPPEYKIQTVIEGETNPATPPSNLQWIKTLDLNYDVSGDTKVKTKTTTQDGIILKQIIDIFGLTYTSAETYNETAKAIYAPAANFWRQVEHREETYIYDDTTGYLLSKNISGWKKVRYQQETDQLETLSLQSEAETDPDVAYEKSTYEWKTISLQGRENYVLAQFRDFWGNSPDSSSAVVYFERCDKSGNIIKDYRINPGYVERRFAIESYKYINSFGSIENPANLIPGTDPKLPPLTTGEYKVEQEIIRVLPSENTYNTNPVLNKYYVGGNAEITNAPDRYRVFRKLKNASESGFTNAAEDTSQETIEGTPGEQPKLTTNYTLKDNKVEQGTEEKKDEDKKQKVYTYRSSDYTGKESVSGKDYFDVDTKLKAERCVEIKIERELFNNANSVSFNIFKDNKDKEGFYCSFLYNNKSYYNCRIKQISKTINIKGRDIDDKLLLTQDINYTVVLPYTIPNIIFKEEDRKQTDNESKNIDKNDNNPTVILPYYYESSLLGIFEEMLSGITNRGNF